MDLGRWSFARFVRYTKKGLAREAAVMLYGWKGETGSKEVREQARPGYAVGGMIIKAGDREGDAKSPANSIKLIYMRIKGDQLYTADSYQSPLIGGSGGIREIKIGGKGTFVVGIHGRAGSDLDAVGLVVSSKADLARPTIEFELPTPESPTHQRPSIPDESKRKAAEKIIRE